MIMLDFNNLSDERANELANLFAAWIENPETLQYSNGKLFRSFVTLYVNTPEELVIVTTLFARNDLFDSQD